MGTHRSSIHAAGCSLAIVILGTLAACNTHTTVVTTSDGGSDPGSDAGGTAPAGNTTGSGAYEDSLGDYPVTIVDAYATLDLPAERPSGGFRSELEIKLVNVTGACDDRGADLTRKNQQELELKIRRVGASAAEATIEPGTYTFEQDLVEIDRAVSDGECAWESVDLPASLLPSASPRVNEIVLTTLTATRAAGSFEIEDSSGNFVKGTFDAEICTKERTGPRICR